MAASRRPGIRFPPSLVVFLIVAGAFGGAAALLTAPSVAPTFQETGNPVTNLPTGLGELGGVAILVLFGVWFVYRLTQRASSSSHGVMLGAFLVVLLFCIAFIIAARFVGGGGGFVANRPGAPLNQTGSTPPTGTPANGSFNGTGYSWLSFPPWLFYVLFFGVDAVILLVALPFLLARHRERHEGTEPPASADEIRASLAQALKDLDVDPSVDPRRRIIAAYAKLLERVDRRVPLSEPLTAREIERECTTRLRVTPSTAHELTSLFEEARYSQHPMDESSVARARAALNRALSDLDSGPGRW